MVVVVRLCCPEGKRNNKNKSDEGQQEGTWRFAHASSRMLLAELAPVQFASGSTLGAQRMPLKQPLLGQDEELPHQISEYESPSRLWSFNECEWQVHVGFQGHIKLFSRSTCWTSSATAVPMRCRAEGIYGAALQADPCGHMSHEEAGQAQTQ